MKERTWEMQVTCVNCNKTTKIMVNAEDLFLWQDGALIQNVMPYLSKNERELLISHYCKSCFDKIMGK